MSIKRNLTCIDINRSIFSGWFSAFVIIEPFLFILQSCLLDFRKTRDTSFTRDTMVSTLTTLLNHVPYVLLFFNFLHFLYALRISLLKHMPSVFTYLAYFMLFLSALHQFHSHCHFLFFKCGRRTDFSLTC